MNQIKLLEIFSEKQKPAVRLINPSRLTQIEPAFAITIHKLQGQTINSPLFIDYNDIPYKESKYHLLYTAISRCKNPNDVWQIHRVRWNSKERVSLNNGKIGLNTFSCEKIYIKYPI